MSINQVMSKNLGQVFMKPLHAKKAHQVKLKNYALQFEQQNYRGHFFLQFLQYIKWVFRRKYLYFIWKPWGTSLTGTVKQKCPVWKKRHAPHFEKLGQAVKNGKTCDEGHLPVCVRGSARMRHEKKNGVERGRRGDREVMVVDRDVV